jgi:bifunctional DNA-binding transcriptional regulator/antitoxin component of YhaV-PrlF toxin-antitoxin module
MNNLFVENAKVIAKGQITLSKDIHEVLGVGMGDRVTLFAGTIELS